MIGTSVACAICQTAWQGDGLQRGAAQAAGWAGQERRPLSASMAIAGMVLMAQMASAPASTTAAAMRPMSGTFGAGFSTIGMSTAAPTAAVTAAAAGQLAAKISPNSALTFGQLMLTSSRSRPGRGDDLGHPGEVVDRVGEDAGDQRHAERGEERLRLG